LDACRWRGDLTGQAGRQGIPEAAVFPTTLARLAIDLARG
jgi:hypothetical protein